MSYLFTAQVAADQCRYAVGVLLPNELSNETTAVLKSNGLCQHTLPTIEKAFMTDFPATSFLSCFFMVIKVYGNMEYHMKVGAKQNILNVICITYRE